MSISDPNLALHCRLMRRTGKLHTLTVISAGLSILANVLISFWNERTGWFHLWFDIVPQAFGMASLITTTLIVSYRYRFRSRKRQWLDADSSILGYDSECEKGRYGGGHWQYVPLAPGGSLGLTPVLGCSYLPIQDDGAGPRSQSGRRRAPIRTPSELARSDYRAWRGRGTPFLAFLRKLGRVSKL